MAFFALMEVTMSKYFIDSCQCPERSCFISTPTKVERNIRHEMFQRPKRALFISTKMLRTNSKKAMGFNALNGLFSFLQYPLEPRINTGFPPLFLQVFV